MSTSVSSVVSHFPKPQNGFTTTTSGSVASGAATVGLASVAGYVNGDVAVFVIDPTDAAKKQTFTGIIDTSGVQVTSVVWTAGTNQTHALGATVVDYAAATHVAMTTKGLLVEHKQAGTHAAVTADSVTVATGKITTSAVGKLEDRSIPLDTYRSGFIFDYVVSGGVWTADSAGVNRNGSMTAIVVMINGQLLNSTNSSGLAAITAHTFTASKDTYIDILNTSGVGTMVYTEVSNNAASPALAANSVRIGIVVTAAGSIAAAASINQGQEDRVLPIVSSIPYAVTDSLGNLICPRDANRKVLGYRQITSNFSTASLTVVQVTGLTCPVIVPTGRKIKVSVVGTLTQSGANRASITIWDGTVGGTQIQATNADLYVASAEMPLNLPATITPTSVSKTYNVGLNANATTASLVAVGTSRPAYIIVELA